MAVTNLRSAGAGEKRVAADPEHGYALPARYCMDDEIFEREKETIFYRTWQVVCHTSDLGEFGSYVTHSVLDQNIMVIRGRDSTLRAFYNVCSHRAHELLKGRGTTGTIVCPYHAWSYHADGSLCTARGRKNVTGFDANEFCLKAVRIEVFAGFVFINLDPNAPALASQAPGLDDEIRDVVPGFDSMVKVAEQRSEIRCNWKVAIDNYLECYHCKSAHPAFANLVDLGSYRSKISGIHSSHIGERVNPKNKAYAFSPDDPVQRVAFWYLWPFTVFNVYPGRPILSVGAYAPTGSETTAVQFSRYALSKTLDERDLARISYFDNVLGPEDFPICESVQRGLHARCYTQGRFIVDRDRTEISEHALHHFHRLVQTALGD